MQTVVVKTFDNYFSANIILTRLQDEGITCYLFDENTVTIGPILSNAIGYIKLVVDKKDERIARETLARFEEEQLQSVQCPKCFNNDFQLISKPSQENLLTRILNKLFSNNAIAQDEIYQCRQCGYETKSLPQNVAAYN